MLYKEYQPLRMSSGWNISWNCFLEVDPSEENMECFPENLLYMISENRMRSIELQWQPEDNPNGAYILKVINLEANYNSISKSIDLEGDWEAPYFEFKSKNRLKIVDKLEELMFTLDENKDPRILKSKGVVDEPSESYRLGFLKNGLTEELVTKILENGNKKLQHIVLDKKEYLNKTIITRFFNESCFPKIKKKAEQLLNNKKFK